MVTKRKRKTVKDIKKRVVKDTKKRIIKDTRIRVKKWFLIYNGPHKHIKLPGVGRIIPGKEYPISAAKANQFKDVDPKLGWKVLGRIFYEEK